MATAALDTALQQSGASTLAISGLPTLSDSALYYVSVRVWKSVDPAGTLVRETFPTPLDLRAGSGVAYSVNIDTANGRARAAPVTLDRVSIGGITERSVPALIAPSGQLRTNLLGMSFLNRLESWEVRGDKLLLRGYP